MALSLPQYQLGPKDSVLTTMAYLFWYFSNTRWTRSMATKLPLHPIPERLNDLMSFLILYLFTIREDKEGMGENKETFTTSTSISNGETPVFSKSLSRVEKRMSSISETASSSVEHSSRPVRKLLGQ
ncbi:hypothetical protein TorRG33x02_127770 [Trema orientale]|uniref:Uncharacterized protein n=1 Tax=Trema orientale TaxID=63057 RepID=A0A2P5F118_TREOI|nr:hypothetical protein TorRG33x02_127770 [Trema orientale]